MKKKLLSLALAVVLCLGLMAVPASAAASAAVVKPLEGYQPSSTHRRIYSEGMLVVEKNSDGFGMVFLDRDGNEISGGPFSQIQDFSEGLAAVVPATKMADYKGWGYIDKSGEMVIEPQFKVAGQFHNGLARVQDNETEKWGIIDKSGSVVIPLEYDRADDIHEPSDGLIAAYDRPSGFWGYFDTTGRVAIPFQYANAYDFKNGYAEVRLGQRDTYIDKSGRDIIPQQYEYIEQLTADGEPLQLFSARDTTATGRNDYYLLNGSGQVVAGPYDSFGSGGFDKGFISGLMPVVKYDGSNYLKGYINTAGQEVIPCQYLQQTFFVDGYAMVSTGDNCAIINTAGQVTASLTPERYMNIVRSSSTGAVDISKQAGEGFFIVRSDESGRQRYGFINAAGQQVVDYKYKYVRPFSGGVAVVQDFADQYGLINTAGQEILPCTYNYVSEFINGVAIVGKKVTYGTLYGLINTAGQEILPCLYNQNGLDEMGIAFVPALESGDKDVCGIVSIYENNGYHYYLVHVTTDPAPAQPETPVTPVQPVTPTVGNFTDVAATSPFKDAILWAVDQGITNGTSGTTFSPSATCTVRQILTFLYRAAGKPGAAEGQSDLDAAVAWATSQGLLAEGADSAAACTRSMAVEFMWKAAGSPAPTQSASFSDVSADAGYADAVAWAVEKGITNGTGGDTFSPNNTCTRGQIVTFLYRNK